MALYTLLSEEAFARIAEAFGLGRVRAVEGIAKGSINTNHRATCEAGRFFVRHTTQRTGADLAFEAGLVEVLVEGHFPAAPLVRTRAGEAALALEGGWVSVFHWMPGEERARAELTPEHLERLGLELGKLHRLGMAYGGARDNPYGPDTVAGWLAGLEARPEPPLRDAARELARAQAAGLGALGGLEPRGPIHADLFLDNVKWLGERVSAVYDFEMACVAPLGLDVAITLNAWCFVDGAYALELARALVRGYQGERPLGPVERENLWAHALLGAVRFCASRIRDYHLSPLPPERLVKKDWRTYHARVRALLALGPAGLRAALGL